MSVASELTTLNTAKQNIKQAIIDKGVGMGGVPFTNYHTKIAEISGGGGAGFRIWRVYVTAAATSGTYFCNIAEIKLRNSVGGDDIELIPELAMSSSYDTNAGFENRSAFDSDPVTLWSTLNNAAGPAWVGIPISSTNDIKQLVIQAGNNSTRAARAPTSFLLQYSDDGDHWITILTRTNEPAWSVSESRLYSI